MAVRNARVIAARGKELDGRKPAPHRDDAGRLRRLTLKPLDPGVHGAIASQLVRRRPAGRPRRAFARRLHHPVPMTNADGETRRTRSSKRREPPPDRARRWSARVTATSDALDLEEGVFTKESPRAIAASLKRSAERSRRRKTDPYRSAMSMLTFFINRGGRGLSPRRRAVLERAKDELRGLFGRAPSRARRAPRRKTGVPGA